MRQLLVAILAGLLFGAGLAISDMINPARVLAFLDVSGQWDPSLALVMGGALIPSAIAYLIRRKMGAPVCEARFHVPTRNDIDRPLVLGAVLFGIGWGLVGLCPGPAIAGLISLQWESGVFVLAMLAGMTAHRLRMHSADPASR